MGTKQLVISTCNIASLARNISSLFHLSLQSCDCAESLSFPSFSVEQKHGRPLDNCRETSTHLISGVCVAYYEFPGDRISNEEVCRLQTSHHSHSHTSSLPLILSSLFNIGLAAAYHRAQNRQAWRSLVVSQRPPDKQQ